jgi:hypothetical protein
MFKNENVYKRGRSIVRRTTFILTFLSAVFINPTHSFGLDYREFISQLRNTTDPKSFLMKFDLSQWRAGFVIYSESPDRKLVSARDSRLIMMPPGMSDFQIAFRESGREMEIIRFENSRFRPSLILFGETSGPMLIEVSSELARCQGCHVGKDPKSKNSEWAFRPNWLSYAFWPEMLGFTDYTRSGHENAQPEAEKFIRQRLSDPFFQKLYSPQLSNQTPSLIWTRRLQEDLTSMTDVTFFQNQERMVAHVFNSLGEDSVLEKVQKIGLELFIERRSWLDFLPRGERKIANDFAESYVTMAKQGYTNLGEKIDELAHQRFGARPVGGSARTFEEPQEEVIFLSYLMERKGLGNELAHWSTAFSGLYQSSPPLLHSGSRQPQLDNFIAKFSGCGERKLSIWDVCKQAACRLFTGH